MNIIKMNIKKLLTTIAAVALTLPIGGCSNIKQVSGADFIAQTQHINALESAQYTTYIGASASRAYLEYWSASPISSIGNATVIWAPISDLPADVATKIKAGVNPWLSKK